MMKKLYEKSELSFALFWIVVYCIAQSTAFPLSQMIGIESAANAAFSVILTVILFCWVKKNGLMERYGLCRTSLPAARFLWYLPLVLLVSENLWNGVAINFPLADTLCYMTNMLCVGFLEEILFRGFLFKAIIAKDGAKKAIIISSVTFGLGHLLNLLNGRGMELVTNLCQVTGAIAIGFLLVTIFYRGGSLWPCILTHSGIDMVSTFGSEAGLTDTGRIILNLIRSAIVIAYTLILMRTLPEGEEGGHQQSE